MTPGPGNRLVVSYLMLRKAIGGLGMVLPFVLVIGGMLLFGLDIQPTVSDYYHTGMRDVFVGILFAMGVFLFSYKGYGPKDNYAGNLASVFVIGTALFPTTPVNPTGLESALGTIHIVCATAYFLTLAYFSLVLFTKHAPNRPMTVRKKQRNQVYRTCGYGILGAIALMAIYAFAPSSFKEPIEQILDPIFWLEAFAVLAFGLSWYVKGEGILEDEK
ncbi:MAG: DUF998 domain-containing protein [Cyanobacteria bacterium J06597_16]